MLVSIEFLITTATYSNPLIFLKSKYFSNYPPPVYPLLANLLKTNRVENTKQRLERLLQAENWSDDDRLWLEKYLNSTDINELRSVALEQYSKDLTELKKALDKKLSTRMLDAIHQRIRPSQSVLYFNINTLYRIAAVVIFLVITTGLYFYLDKSTAPEMAFKKPQLPEKNDIAPGGQKAVLTLADGSKITLDDAGSGEIAKQAGISITKTPDGKLIYSVAGSQSTILTSQPEYNTIETPKGGQYQINLPDGSKVWLNAASSLRFPLTFIGNERKVELTGEAYFEVAHITSPSLKKPAKDMPFIVSSGNHTVEVLGTHFNINAYNDEPSIKTTLLEGRVRVSLPSPSGEKPQASLSQLLIPGQQSKADKTIKVFTVDTEEAVAWKNGYFMFNNENIPVIMRKISRWYNVEIEYRGDISQKVVWGSVSRFKNVSEVTDMLELTGLVHFKIEENRIIVMP